MTASDGGTGPVYEKVLAALKDDIGEFRPLHPDMNLAEARKASLGASFYKKLLPMGFDIECDRRAEEKFLDINTRLRTRGPVIRDSLWYRFQGILSGLLCGIDQSELSVLGLAARFDVGPGASGKVDSRSFYHKLRDTPSCTSEALYRHYRAAVCSSPTLAAQVEAAKVPRVNILAGNRLFFVPKNNTISRTCCTEPLVNMYYQKAIGSLLEDVLRRVGIDLSTQPGLNQDLARRGSIDGSFGTIDLTSASDSMSWLDLISPSLWGHSRQLLGLMAMSRCERTVLPDGSAVELAMISTMGNGFTFPLQTLVFTCALLAVYDSMRIPMRIGSAKNFGVFGDDIVVRREAYDQLVDFLIRLGFEVNVGKSFNTGPFRESCGTDWLRGVNIRGVYIRSLQKRSDTYSAYNRVVRWSVIHETPLWSTIGALKALCGNHVVPFQEDDAAGRKVSYAEASSRTKRHGIYRQVTYRCLVFEPKSQSVERLDQTGASPLIGACRFYGAIRFPAVPVGTDPGFGRLVLSPKVVPGSWRERVKSTPWWDYAPGIPPAQFQSWKTLVDLLGSSS